MFQKDGDKIVKHCRHDQTAPLNCLLWPNCLKHYERNSIFCDRSFQLAPQILIQLNFRNNPKFWHTQALTNSADLDQTTPLHIRLNSGSTLFVIPFVLCAQFFSVKRPLYLNFREITANFSVSDNFGALP